MITLKKYVFGYGSLINCSSASKALNRNLSKEDIILVNLINFQRNWSLWDEVFSLKLQKNVKGIFLNILQSQGNYMNGIIIEVSDEELKNLVIREKNYDCIDVTNNIEFTDKNLSDNFEVYSFIGKNEYIFDENILDGYIFENYIKIVDVGLINISEEFRNEFYKTTLNRNTSILEGAYSFIDYNQQKLV
ncbi:gamma-glutamylcyclotransferase [Larkinella knui]|uniref:Gamma-glutamylcyclotransferase n=1 Tax=Larkinella knui TaxID=2025310 RepID=A0A3P1CXK8_9BACT|nr:hypothetical protein [Larkinella knui]RRB18162.1 hypothetical protein EHT87_07765 [Larkinella knui]